MTSAHRNHDVARGGFAVQAIHLAPVGARGWQLHSGVGWPQLSGPGAFDLGVAMVFGGPAVWMLTATAFMLFRRWTFAWIVHWMAIMCAIVFGIAAGVLLALGSNS